jgi:CheY-like chemotaxis protein
MRTVLVADPNATFATVVADALQRLGSFDVVLAATGPEALQKSASARPHLAVLDGALPDCRIPDLIDQLRQVIPNLPVVLMPLDAADVPPDSAVQGVLTKPFFLPDLPALITEILGPDPEAGVQTVAPAPRPRNARLAVTGPLNVASPLRARLTQTGALPSSPAASLTPSPAPQPASTPASIALGDEARRLVETRIEAMSRALRDEPVFLSRGERVFVMVPRLSPSAATALVQVVRRAWETQAAAPEVIRFEGETEINRYMLYSVRVAGDLALSVALRTRVPLPIVRRVARDTAAEVARAITPVGSQP